MEATFALCLCVCLICGHSQQVALSLPHCQSVLSGGGEGGSADAVLGKAKSAFSHGRALLQFQMTTIDNWQLTAVGAGWGESNTQEFLNAQLAQILILVQWQWTRVGSDKCGCLSTEMARVEWTASEIIACCVGCS